MQGTNSASTVYVCEPSDTDTHSVLLLRFSPHSQRRLSDLMVGVDVGEIGPGLEGHLEDLMAPELESMPQQEDALDHRLEAAGESSLAALTVHSVVLLWHTACTCFMCMT